MIRPLESLISTCLRGRLVNPPLPFIARELSGRHDVRAYRVRDSDLWVNLQHGTPDIYGLDQTFHQHLFELPPPAAAALQNLGRPPRALDLGANIGLFGLWMFGRYPEGYLTAFEPDPRNARLLSMTIEANDLRERWRLIEAAVGTREGEVRFAAGEFGTSHIAAPTDTGALTVALTDLFDHTADVDLLKIDIEGAEWEILRDPRFGEIPAKVIALDYHDQGCPEDDPHRPARDLMSSWGFEVLPIPQEGASGGMLWAWR